MEYVKDGTCRNCGPTGFYRSSNGQIICGNCYTVEGMASSIPTSSRDRMNGTTSHVYCWKCRERTYHTYKNGDNRCNRCNMAE